TMSKTPEVPTLPVQISKPLLARPQPSPSPSVAVAETDESTSANSEYLAAPRHPIKIVKPRYPRAAELRRIEGEVILELEVDPRGVVQTVRTLNGDSLLGEAAKEAARQWRFPPAENQSVSTVTRARFNFKLPAETNR